MKRPSILALAALALAALSLPALAQNHWHISTYWAESIDGHGPGNHALYCGDETIPPCSPEDAIGGIGPGWVDDVEWRHTVADPRRPATVQLTGLMNYDLNDLNWDFLHLYVQRGDQLDELAYWTGISEETVALDFTASLTPEEFSGPDSNEIRLVWRVVTSLDGWDDVDCLNPSHGACQIDDLSVHVDGALITFDDFEPGSPVHWDPVVDEVTAADDVPAITQVAVSAFPNPFNPRTTIAFDLPRTSVVSLAIFDAQGRLVRDLLSHETVTAGSHQQAWNGRDDRGQAVASGTYFYRFTAGRQSWNGKLTMLK